MEYTVYVVLTNPAIGHLPPSLYCTALVTAQTVYTQKCTSSTSFLGLEKKDAGSGKPLQLKKRKSQAVENTPHINQGKGVTLVSGTITHPHRLQLY
jgi:hypothetical protein